ncbi:MAG: HAD family hydrolase [Sphingobacteriaceae bacterium]|nr:MAG: HAD family hydrolase [Sphingobacteriaceae bacterium]
MLHQFKVLLWDFDGVIMDSMPTRTLGFSEVLKEYPEEQVKELLNYHHINGGLSRYVKFRYFFEKIRNESITDEQVLQLSQEFSVIMLSLLQNEKLLIADAVEFIREAAKKFKMHVVSGSDQTELRHICHALGLDKYFISIHGSPTPKTELVNQVIADNNYNKDEVVMIGDSINDYDAAHKNGISFCGYNSEAVRNLSGNYIEKFADL